MYSVLLVSDCSPVLSPAPSWQRLIPAGGFVAGVRWRMHGYDLVLTAERLGQETFEKNALIFPQSDILSLSFK